jgi:protein CWC15
MSTAGRATYQAAKGSARSSTINTQKVSGRDQTAHTKLKYRQIGQSSKDELKNKNLKDDLEGREHKYLLSNNKETKWMVKEEEKKVDVNTILSEKPKINFEEVQKKYDDADIDVNDSDEESESEKDDDTKSDNDNKNRKGDDDSSR